MTPIFKESDEAFQDLPVPLQDALRRYAETRSDDDLHAVIGAALSDLGVEVERGAIRDDANFIEDLGLDSLAIAEFVFFFEDIFHIKITNEVLAELRTLGELKAFLKGKLA